MKLIENLRKSIPIRQVDYSSSVSQLDSVCPRIYGTHSNKLEELSQDFLPYAKHIIDFISAWTLSNPEYGYEIISTRRSWYSQKKVTTIFEDYKNGLSWYLYGNAISINVFKKSYNELFTVNGAEDVVHNPLNFEDGSAKKFILDANEWFISNPVTINGSPRVLKIFGIYPSLPVSLKDSMSEKFAKYKDDVDVIYWGGLFSSYSNFTHWEWHPGLLPNEIWKRRAEFLNTSLLDVDFTKLIAGESQGNTYSKKYLPNHIAIVEEDLLSLIKLKLKINLNREYSVLELFDWCNSNPNSLLQMISYYIVSGEYDNVVLFTLLQSISPGVSLKYDTEGKIMLLGALDTLKLVYDDGDQYHFEYYDEFGDKITIQSDATYALPVDNKLLSDEFDLIELSVDDGISELYPSSLSDATITQTNEEILGISNSAPNVIFEINEHGMIGELSIMTEKILSLEDRTKNITENIVFEEMITPPNQIITNKVKGSKIIDISKISSINQISNESKIDQMVNPDLLF